MRTYCVLNLFLYVLCWANDNIHPETRLREDLLTFDCHPLSRPIRNLTTVTFVEYIGGIYQLVGFNSIDQSIELLMFQTLRWHSEFLKWDPANYSGIEKIRIFQNNIWKPDILLYNEIINFDYEKFFLIEPLTVNYSGAVSWSQPIHLETTCSMEVTNFPFDSQTCEIVMGSWQYTLAELRLVCDELDLRNYIPDSLWVLQGMIE